MTARTRPTYAAPAPPPESAPCCGQPAIPTTDGHWLEPDVSLGIHRPDGTTLTVADALNGERGRLVHECPKPEQGVLL